MKDALIRKVAMIAKELGCEIVNPPILIGRSGVEHTFSLLVAWRGNHCAVDVYDSAEEGNVLSTQVKKFDTGASICILSLGRAHGESARKMASMYGIGYSTVEEMNELINSERETPGGLVSS